MGTERRKLKVMPERQVISPNIADVFERTAVVAEQAPGGQVKYQVVYKLEDPNGEKEKGELQFHLQGFVVNRNLSPLGSWKPT